MIQLNNREKIAVSIGGISLLFFVILQFAFFPLAEKRAKLIKGLASREKAGAEMQIMQEQYRQLRKQSGSVVGLLAKREAGFSLFSFLEKSADDSTVKDHIAYMKPSASAKHELFNQTMVEMKLQAISLKQLVGFLEKAESPENLVGIDKITVQENTKEKGSLDVTLHIVSIDQTAAASPQ
jgi:general secretion pathway protein M